MGLDILSNFSFFLSGDHIIKKKLEVFPGNFRHQIGHFGNLTGHQVFQHLLADVFTGFQFHSDNFFGLLGIGDILIHDPFVSIDSLLDLSIEDKEG